MDQQPINHRQNEMELNDLDSLTSNNCVPDIQLQGAFDEMVTNDQNQRLSEASNKYDFNFTENSKIIRSSVDSKFKWELIHTKAQKSDLIAAHAESRSRLTIKENMKIPQLLNDTSNERGSIFSNAFTASTAFGSTFSKSNVFDMSTAEQKMSFSGQFSIRATSIIQELHLKDQRESDSSLNDRMSILSAEQINKPPEVKIEN